LKHPPAQTNRKTHHDVYGRRLQVQDLSSRTDGFPSFGSSMNGTNMVSADPAGALPSTSSEATDGIPRGNPDLDIPAAYDAPNRQHADTFDPTPVAWTDVEGVG
jgi:hypothetical protein